MGGFFIVVSAIVLALLFFPIYLEADIYYNAAQKKIAFSMYLFKWIKVIGGYITPYPGGFAFHTKRNKALLMPINDKESGKKRMLKFRRFHISDLAVNTETGAEYLPLTLTVHTMMKGYFLYQGGEKDSYQSHIWLRNGDVFTCSVNGVARFNLYMQICTLLQYLKEKM